MTEPLTDDPLWYKDALIYQLHVKAYKDSSQDGIGDFRGLIEKLDYIQALGVNTVWLLPFYPSPQRDDGYDIADYRNVNPDYGTRRDVRAFVREAHHRGLRVITELVINHTSDQHPWFQAARRAPKNSAKRNFYVWSDDDKKFSETRIIFTDTETSNWAWDPLAQQYYWHRFFSHQPDLNHNNPAVVKAVIRLMRFWLDMGVDGLRLDAIPYLCVRAGTNNENLPETHEVIRQMRAVVDQHYKNRLFLAEANQWPEDVREYFGDGDECHMAYHFPLMPRMYMAVAQEDRHPIVEIMQQTPEIPDNCQWAIFLRNHDELTLEMVTDRERDYMYRTYAAEPRMRVNVGIRRRLAPLLENDLDKIKLMNSLLLSMPGSPVIYYGDEIGMGDNIYLGDRNGVRTPMQWSPDRNAGFSRADPQKLYLPPIMDPIYGYEAVNVETQTREPSSLLNWMKRLIAVRKNHQAFGRGSLHIIKPGNRKILAYLREYQDETILCIANLGRTAQPVELDLGRFRGAVPVELIGHTPFPPIGELPYLLTLPGYGFYWFHLSYAAAEPVWHQERLPPTELPVLVLSSGWDSFFPDRVEPKRRAMAGVLRSQLEQILPGFLLQQRWFAGKDETVANVNATLRDCVLWSPQGADGDHWLLTRIDVQTGAGSQAYFLPLAIAQGDDDEVMRGLGPSILAKVRRQARVGALYDAFADDRFCRALVSAMGEGERSSPVQGGELQFSASAAFAAAAGPGGSDAGSGLSLQRAAGSSNSAVVFGDKLFLKGYRRLEPGLNPELEIGRFLTEKTGFGNIAPLLGAVQYRSADGESFTWAILQGYTPNQGDAWNYTQSYLQRFLENVQQQALEAPESHGVYLLLAETMGRRTGELHKALATVTGDPAFDPEPLQRADLQAWRKRLRSETDETLKQLRRALASLPESSRSAAERVLGASARLKERISALPQRVDALKTRCHGDYHLGQILVAENDVVIVDFEGEPARPLAERRHKQSPLKDIAGLLRSFDYAAYSALNAVSVDRPETRSALEPQAYRWQQQAAAACLGGYASVLADSPILPADAGQRRALIEGFVLEKALYELRYELANRPAWVNVPLQGLSALSTDE